MKKFLFAGLMASLMLAACASDDATARTGDGGDTESIVTYDVSTDDVQTRGEAMSHDNFSKSGRKFKLWAWQTSTTGATSPMTSDHNSTPLQNVTVVYGSDGWEAEGGPFFWPRPKNAASVDFYAIFPSKDDYADNGVTFDTTNKRFDFSSEAVRGNADVMYATYTDSRTERGTATSKAAKLSFRHIMSQIEFKAARSSELDVTITSLKICNINSQGIYSFDKPSGQANGTDWQGSWSGITGLTNYPLTLKDSEVRLSVEVQDLNTAANVLMLIPQVRAAWNPADAASKTIAHNNSGPKGCYLEIGCTIKMGGDTYDDNGYIYYPLDANWEIGRHYTYTLGFGTGYNSNGQKGLTDILLESEVTDWVDGGAETSPDIYI